MTDSATGALDQLTINGGPATRLGGRITLLERQRRPGLRADLRIAEPGDIEVSTLSCRSAQQVDSRSMKSAGAGYRSTSRTTLPAPGHRIPRTSKYVSGLVFRSDAAACSASSRRTRTRAGQAGPPSGGGPGPRCRPGAARCRGRRRRRTRRPGCAAAGRLGGIAPPGQQRPDLAHRAGHRGPVHPVHDRQRGVRDLQPQHRQRDQYRVDEHHVPAQSGARRAQPAPAAALTQVRLPAGLPRAGQFGDYAAQVVTGDPDEGSMAQGRTSP